MNAAAEQDSTEATELVQNENVGIIDTSYSDVSGNEDSNVKADGLNTELASKWLIWQCKMIADVILSLIHI